MQSVCFNVAGAQLLVDNEEVVPNGHMMFATVTFDNCKTFLYLTLHSDQKARAGRVACHVILCLLGRGLATPGSVNSVCGHKFPQHM